MKLSEKIMSAPGYRPDSTAKPLGQRTPNKVSEPKMSKSSFGGSIGHGGSSAVTSRSLDRNNGQDQAKPAPERGARGNRPTAGGPSGYGPRKTGEVTKPAEANGVALRGPAQQPLVVSMSDTSKGQAGKSRG